MPPLSFLATLTHRLALFQEGHLERHVLPVEERRGPLVCLHGQWLVDFSANDVLGLGSDADLAWRLWRQVRPHRLSAGAARLVSGDSPQLRAAEAALAQWCNTPTALLFPSASHANAALASLFRPDETVIVDKAVHGSIRHGLSAARCQVRSFRHNTLPHLQRLLTREKAVAVWTESLFSMDGDTPDLPGLAGLCDKHEATLLLDEAHAFGVLGPNGAGLGAAHAPIRTIGFGKAFGLVGGAILGPPAIREALLHLAPPAMFTTALPPWWGELLLGVIEEARRREAARQHVAQLAAYARSKFAAAGCGVHGNHHILSLPIGKEAHATAAAHHLATRGYLVFAARYPTVPLGKARLRLVICAHHTFEHIDGLVDALSELPTVHLDHIHA